MSHPAPATAFGRAKAPVPTIRLKIYATPAWEHDKTSI